MTDGQIVLLFISFILSIVNFIFLIVSIKVDGEIEEEFREKFFIIHDYLSKLNSHKEKVEKILKLENDK